MLNIFDPHFGTYKNIADKWFIDNLAGVGTNTLGMARNIVMAPVNAGRRYSMVL